MGRKSFLDSSSRTVLPGDHKKEHLSYEDTSKTSTSKRDLASGTSILKLGRSYSKKENYMKLIDCECGPDLYNRVLGPTADEIVLGGLQTIFNMFGKFTKCDKEIEAQIEEPKKSKSVVKVISEVMESVGLPPEMVSRIIQTSFEELEEERPELVSKVLQTSTPEMISRILSTVGLEPEMISEILSAMTFESDKPSLRSGMMQTSTPSTVLSTDSKQSDSESVSDSRAITNKIKKVNHEPNVTLEDTKGPIDETKVEYNKVVSVYMQTSDSHLSLEPKEEIPEKLKMCVCCECVKLEDEDVVLPKKEDDVIRKIDSELRSGDHQVEKPKLCICCKCIREIKEQVPCPQPCPPPVDKCKCDTKSTNTKCSTLQKLCRCYECSAPVVFKTRRTSNGCICPKPEIKCNCYSTKHKEKASSSTHIALAKGDTCSLVETSCCCEKKKPFSCCKNH